MANIQDILYHGIRESMRLVLDKMGNERLDKGLIAFEDGSHDWGNCFFARAFKGEVSLNAVGNPEEAICRAIGLLKRDGTPNYIPVRTIWHTFDHASTLITAKELEKFVVEVRDGSRDPGVMDLLRSIRPADAEREVTPRECGVPA